MNSKANSDPSNTVNAVSSPEHLSEKLSGISEKPGVYLMKDDEGKVLYVGKARNLKKRLTSYFTRLGKPDIKTWVLLKKVTNFETILTTSEKEALILESNLIKRYKPKYNVDLKDDKRYLSLRLNPRDDYPNLTLVRKIEKKNDALYFGPFSSAQAVRQTLKFIHRTFKLRRCRTRDFKNRTRPCLNYQMESCLAPCCLEVDPKVYGEMVREVILFIKGRTPELIRKIKTEMTDAAEHQDYERAATLRDKMFALEKTLEKQVAVTTDFLDRDVLGMAGSPEFSVITLLSVRGGFLLGTRHFSFQETMSTKEETTGAFIRQYYESAHLIPKEILLPFHLDDGSFLEERLTAMKREKVTLLWPRRGEKVHLVNMAAQNAENELTDRIAARIAEREMLGRLQKRLHLNRLPSHIECFDNSTISGASPVAGMVVFEAGKPKKSSYRRYAIKTVAAPYAPDDYAYMVEILKRRLGKGAQSEPFPDLLMVDGGKGQLNIALSVLRELGLADRFDVIGIAKKDEKREESDDKIYKPGRANPISFGREGDLLLFLQRVRDEAHRFAISFHRKRRTKNAMGSALDAIPGIGAKRKKILLRHFGSIKKIRAATLEELSELPGMNRKAAEAIKSRLAEGGRQRSEDRGRKSEVRLQRSESRSQIIIRHPR